MEMKDLEKIGRIELKFDQLDGVAGGVITPAQEATLNSVLKQVKGAGKSLEEVLGMIPGYFQFSLARIGAGFGSA